MAPDLRATAKVSCQYIPNGMSRHPGPTVAAAGIACEVRRPPERVVHGGRSTPTSTHVSGESRQLGGTSTVLWETLAARSEISMYHVQ